MTKKKVSTDILHKVPEDLLKVFTSNSKLMIKWEDITPLSRNEWICWIESAKKAETRIRRIKRTCTELIEGKRRPCCFAGCNHRY